MGHARVAHRPPPTVSGGEAHGDMVTYSRDVPRGSRDLMEAELAVWVSRYISRSRVAELMAGARPSIDAVLAYIANAPLPMALPSGGGGPRFRVYLHLLFGKTSSGQWWVRSVGFGMQESVGNMAKAQQTATRARLERQAEDRQARAPTPRWKIYFDSSDGTGDFEVDKRLGARKVQALIDRAHELAKDLEPTMKNPIGWDGETDLSLATETAKAVLGPIAGMGKGGYEVAATAVDGGTKIYENHKERNGFKAAADVMDLGLAVITKNPVSALGSLILGSFLSIAIANDTARVARARATLFAFYIGGFLQQLTDETFDTPKEGSRKTMAAAGANDARGLTPAAAYQVQLALLHYSATHNTENSWSLQDIDKGWTYPDDYRRNWSPSLLARSFVWQINRLKYLTR